MKKDLLGIKDSKEAIEKAIFRWDRIALALNQHAIVSIANRAGEIIYVNEMFCQISGYSEEELLGQNHRVIKSNVHPPEFYREIWKTISSGNNWHGEICNRRKDGDLYWVESTITPIIDDDGQPYQYVSIRTDITQLKRIQRRLHHRNKLRSSLTRIAQQLLAYPANGMIAAVDSSLALSAEAWGVDLLALNLVERGEDNCGIEHCRAYPFLSETAVECLNKQSDGRLQLPIGKSYISLAELDFGSEGLDQHRNGVVVPVKVNAEVSGCLVIAFEGRVDDWWSEYRDYVLLLLDMLASAVRRCRTTNELAISSERLRRGQMYANIGTWEWDIQTGELFWSEKIAPLFGYEQGELDTTYENFIRAVHPEDRSRVEEAVTASIEHDAPYEIEHRVVWPNGDVRWVLERGAVHRDSAGRPLQMLGVVQDINEKKLAQLQLEQRQEELRQAQSMARLASWRFDLTDLTFQSSDNVYEIFGIDKDSKLTVDSLRDTVYAPDQPLIELIVKQINESGRYELAHRILKPDGEIRYIKSAGMAVTDSDGNYLSIMGSLQDITDWVELEQRLHLTEQHFTFAVEGAGDGVWDWDLRKGTVDLSPRCWTLLGYNDQELGLHHKFEVLQELVNPDDTEAVTRSLELYLTGQTRNYSPQFRMRCQDGRYKWILCRGTIVDRDADGNPLRMIGINSDITEIKNKEEELIAARNDADTANRAKSEFLSNMSHELRTPLNAILGFGQLLNLDTSVSSDNREYVQEIVKAGEHLLDLINEVLDLVKVEAGRVMLSIEPVSVTQLLDDISTLIYPLAREKHLEINMNGCAQYVVMADRTRLKQILINLLSNAIKYNRAGGRIFVSTTPGRDRAVRITVEDTGIGISPENLKGIFEPFNRMGIEESGIEGTGIGLTLTKRLVEMMNGRIGVDSFPGSGSRFWVEVPRVETALPESASIIDPAPDKVVLGAVNAVGGPGDITARKTVLYIDDNPSNLKLVKKILQGLPGIDFLDAHNGELGLNVARQTHPDLILVDINMPGTDGYQVLQALRSSPEFNSVPIFAVTANAMPSDVSRGKAAGFDEYIAKPFDVARFNTLVRAYLYTGDESRVGATYL